MSVEIDLNEAKKEKCGQRNEQWDGCTMKV